MKKTKAVFLRGLGSGILITTSIFALLLIFNSPQELSQPKELTKQNTDTLNNNATLPTEKSSDTIDTDVNAKVPSTEKSSDTIDTQVNAEVPSTDDSADTDADISSTDTIANISSPDVSSSDMEANTDINVPLNDDSSDDVNTDTDTNAGISSTDTIANISSTDVSADTVDTEVPSTDEYVDFEVKLGYDSHTVSSLLFSEGLIDDYESFDRYCMIQKADNKLQVGIHKIGFNLSYEEVLEILLTPVTK